MPKKGKSIAIISVALLSFAYQTFLASNHDEHMGLLSRVWQFMIGFLAHELSSHTLWRFNGNDGFFINSLNEVLTILLSICLIISPTRFKQLNRLIVMLLTLVLMIRADKSNRLLCHKFLVYAGNISYSVYLIHWPLFVLNKYINAEMYSHGNYISIGGLYCSFTKNEALKIGLLCDLY